MGRSLHNIFDLPPRIRTRQVHYYMGCKNTSKVVNLEPRSGFFESRERNCQEMSRSDS